MDIDLYGDDSKALLKLDPRTKLLIFVATGFSTMYAFDVEPLMALGTLLCIVVALCGKPAFALKAWIAFAALAWLRWWIEHTSIGADAAVIVLMNVISIALFVFPFMLSLVLLVQTTRVSHFLSALSAMHLPLAVIIPLAVMFRFLPAVIDEWSGIRKAMAFRGIRLDLPSVLRAPGQAIEYLLVPLLFSTISMMDELASASLARGLDSRRARTSYEEVRLRPVDLAMMALFVGLAAWILSSTTMTGA